MSPLASRCWPKRSNSLSISPACANASRNSQIVVASGTGSSRSRSRKRMNDRRSRIRYSVCSSERLWSDCSTTILNFKIASWGLRPALLLRSSGFVSVTLSMSARKSSHRTIFLIVSSGSPLALIASSLRSISKKPVCPMTRSFHPPMAIAISESDSQRLGEKNFSRWPLAIIGLRANTDQEIDAAFEAIAQQRVPALVVGASAFFDTRRKKLIALAARHAVPAIYHFREYADDGGLVSYGLNFPDVYRLVGVYTGKCSKARRLANCRLCKRPNSSLSSISRPPKRSASKSPTICSHSPTRWSSNEPNDRFWREG